MELKVYVHRLSQPARAVLLLCKSAGIEFEEVFIDLTTKQQKTPEFLEINPLGQVPAISHGDFNLYESHAILIYLASAFPGVADHWYPSDLQKRAKVHAVLDWHHSNLRRGSVLFSLNTTLGPVFGFPVSEEGAAEGEKLLSSSLSTIESVFLNDNGSFLLGADKPSIADLSLVCEILQFETLKEEDRKRIMEPHKKVQKWVDDVKNATKAHFDDIHETLYGFCAMLKQKSA
ncbi:glutathione S-transferase T1-like [Mercurialis annua]|uniref:glutathione S-transferase T1-like n=1 Tax=Mercurialis annua TaxID=3986 RepID=UPI00215F1785|nr:glutathione S-transferase T1-like [Mercurialis annua]